MGCLSGRRGYDFKEVQSQGIYLKLLVNDLKLRSGSASWQRARVFTRKQMF